MGWTGIRNTMITDTPKARRELVDSIFNTGGYHVIKSSMHNSTYYAAVRHPEGHVFGLVVLTQVMRGEFMYKEMDESEHPYYYDCPITILNLLSPTENEREIEWRERCRERHNRMKVWNKVKSTPNVRIQVIAQNLGSFSDGSEIILFRCSTLRKNFYWTNGRYRFSEKLVERLTRGYIDYNIVTEDGKNYCDLNYYTRRK